MLTEKQCAILERALIENVEPRKLAAYLCFHMGLTVAEASAVRVEDVDFDSGMLNVRSSLTRTLENGKSCFALTNVESPRELPMPEHVLKFFKQNIEMYDDEKCFLINGKKDVPGAHLLQNLLVSINTKYHIAENITTLDLRGAFIRRCLENGIDIYTVGEYVGIKQLQELQKRFKDFLKPRFEDIALFNPTQEKAEQDDEGKRMNLLILGAGSQGRVVKECAEALGVFDKIAYLDDNRENELAMDSCTNYKKYINLFPIALPSFGDCALRKIWVERLEGAGYIIPVLIHPMATVSPSAKISAGTTVEAKAIIGTDADIGKGCIISSGAIVDTAATVKEYCHVDCGATVKKNSVIESCSKVESGTVVDNGQL